MHDKPSSVLQLQAELQRIRNASDSLGTEEGMCLLMSRKQHLQEPGICLRIFRNGVHNCAGHAQLCGAAPGRAAEREAPETRPGTDGDMRVLRS